MVSTHKIKTWKCTDTNCRYHQDFDPADSILMAHHFPDVPVSKCPACWTSHSNATDSTTLARIDSDMILETNPTKQIVINIATDVEIDNFSNDTIKELGKTQTQLKKQGKEDRTKFDSNEWKA